MKNTINIQKKIKYGVVACTIIGSIVGLTSLSNMEANEQAEFRLREASRVSVNSAFALKDALASEPVQEPGESVVCGENGSECKAKGKENQVYSITGKKQ